jgi:hypothetical protein
MKSKAWITVAKVQTVITALYGVLLITTVAKEISKYNAHPEIYAGGMQSVLWAKKFEILFILLSIPSAVLFFFHSKLGWAMQAALQTLLLLIIIAVTSFMASGGKTGVAPAIAVTALVFIICLLGLLAMFSQAVRTRYSVGIAQYILAAVFVALFAVAYYV